MVDFAICFLDKLEHAIFSIVGARDFEHLPDYAIATRDLPERWSLELLIYESLRLLI